MVFEKLEYTLGKERFEKLLNQLQRGESCAGLARLIQKSPPEGWGVFQGISENTLMMQLYRLQRAMAEGTFGPRIAKAVINRKNAANRLKVLERVSIKVLDRMEDLADIQRDRVMALVEKEKEALLPIIQGKMAPQEYRHLLTQTNLVFNDYRQVLLDLQEIRFKLGMDDFRGPAAGIVRGAVEKTTYPDGSSVQKQVFEAVNSLEKIFNRHQIPMPSEE
jgi:hypothetical protein